MTNEISPRTMARLTGVVYLILIVGGIFAQGFVSDRLVDFHNAGTTASNILSNESLYRTGFTVFLIEMTAQIVMTVLFYYLLKPVSRSGAMLATVLGLTGALIKTVARVFFLAPLAVLHSSAFDASQVNSLALLLLRINNDGAAVALAFFGPSTFLTGWLMIKSTFFPKWMGILSVVGGILWTSYYVPSLGNSLFMVSAIFALVGSLATIGWLIIVGVNEEKWREQAAAASIWA